MIQGLEDPGKSIDTEIEKSASCEFWVHHSMAVGESGLGFVGVAQVGSRAVDRTDLARGNDFADVNREREVSRPDLGMCQFHAELTSNTGVVYSQPP